MPRKKKVKVEETTKNESSEFVYCGWRHCPNTHCLRHNVNTPFNVMILRRKFNPDKDWNCDDMEV